MFKIICLTYINYDKSDKTILNFIINNFTIVIEIFDFFNS